MYYTYFHSGLSCKTRPHDCSLVQGNMTKPHSNGFNTFSSFSGYAYLGAGLCCGLSGLAAGMAIGIVGDAGVRAVGQQEKLFVGV